MEKKNSGFAHISKRLIAIVLGGFLYALGVNMFVVPAGLYNGGLLGFCQIIRTLIEKYTAFSVEGFDFAGILYYILNVPLLALAWFRLNKRFVLKTLLSTTSATVFMTLLPVHSILESDLFTSALVGGIISGVGAGITFWAGCCTGGTDVICSMVIQKNKNSSIGRINVLLDGIIYFCCMLLFNVRVVVYSLVYSVVYSFALDKMHLQNINEEVVIITDEPSDDMQKEIMNGLGRGVTKLPAEGGFTGNKKSFLFVLISKYEKDQLLSIVKKHDPSAFVTVKEHAEIYGNYERKND